MEERVILIEIMIESICKIEFVFVMRFFVNVEMKSVENGIVIL